MGRYRPPAKPSSPYITDDGYQRLELELKDLWVRRTEVTAALAAAAAEGDRSENAEYQYRKKEVRGIDRRIHYLQKRLPRLTVVSGPPADPERVFFGAWISIEDDDGKTSTFRIVGADEFDAAKNWISLDSPVAQALLGKQVDDEISIQTPSGEVNYVVTAIEYPP